MTNDRSIIQVEEILQKYYAGEKDAFSVNEGEADYYIEVKIKDHYLPATLIESFEAIGLTINSFSYLNGEYGNKLMDFSLKGDLKD